MPMGRVARLAICVVAFTIMVVPSPEVVATTPAGFGAQLVRAGTWLGGHGVTVYSNGSSRVVCASTRRSCEGRIGPGIETGLKWQCVELAQRLYIRLGWYARKFGVRFAYQIWWAAPRLGMARVPNGTLSSRDVRPGDMIVWAPDRAVGSAGHVAIVDWVDGSQVAVKEQNWGTGADPSQRQRGESVYALADGWLNGHSLPPRDIYGVVHSPRDRFTNAEVLGSAGGAPRPGTTGPVVIGRHANTFVI
jgi:hypothetical protein